MLSDHYLLIELLYLSNREIARSLSHLQFLMLPLCFTKYSCMCVTNKDLLPLSNRILCIAIAISFPKYGNVLSWWVCELNF